MVNLLYTTLAVVLFIIAMKAFRLVPVAKKALSLTNTALDILSNPDADDLSKEKQMQKLTLKLFGCFSLIVLVSVACFLIPATAIWVLDQYHIVNIGDIATLSISPAFISGTTISCLVAWWAYKKWKKTPELAHKENSDHDHDHENQYSALDQTLHKITFAGQSTLKSISNLEDRLFKKQIQQQNIEQPIFITALPRAGTTLLLDLLYETGSFATHTYRNMPFLLTPILWSKFTQSFKTSSQARPRAHGDGMLVSTDSPEAFEEIIWHSFWKKHYTETYIHPWAGGKISRKFDQFYHQHIRKVLTIAPKPNTDIQLRYISKNNLNIARIPYIKKSLPSAHIVVPFRHPVSHAQSLLRQHKNFNEIHRDDEFACRYMRDIGHYDFGQNLKPINFNHWLDNGLPTSPDTLEFWLSYWLETYTKLANSNESIIIFDYDSFCHDNEHGAKTLSLAINYPDTDKLIKLSKRVEVNAKHIRTAPEGTDEKLLEQCEKTYKRLKDKAIN